MLTRSTIEQWQWQSERCSAHKDDCKRAGKRRTTWRLRQALAVAHELADRCKGRQRGHIVNDHEVRRDEEGVRRDKRPVSAAFGQRTCVT